MSIQDTVVQVSGRRKTCRGGLERFAARATIMTDYAAASWTLAVTVSDGGPARPFHEGVGK